MTQEYDHSAPLHMTSLSQQPLKSTSWASALKMHGTLRFIVKQWAKIIFALHETQRFITLFMRSLVSTLKKSEFNPHPHTLLLHSLQTFPVAYPGGWVVRVFNPPPRNSEGPPKNRDKLNPIVKTVKKIAEFRTPTHQDVQKKGSKILKLPRFAIVLH